ncbi:unnamed protein product [Ectocarpus sp. 12 AP-2014]
MPYRRSMARLALAYLAALRTVSAVTIEANNHAAFVRAPLSSPSTRSYGSTRRSWHSRTWRSRSCTSRVRRYCAAATPGEGSEDDSSQDPVEGSSGGKDAGGGDEGGEEGGKAIADNTAPVGNKADHMVSAVAGNGQVVARAVTARNLLQDALIRQDLYPLAADALGRVMVCTMLMAGGLKDRETFQLTFSGSGPLGGVVAISDGEGGVRGYVTNGKVELPLKDNGNQDVAQGIGEGLLKVVRNHPDYQRPYTGITALKTGEVAYDAASYLAESEQKSCAIAAGCFVTDALVRQAGGYMLETLPEASEETEKTVINNIAKLLARSSDPSDLMGRGMTPISIVESLLEGLGGVGAITYKRPEFLCHCSDERVYTALKLLEKTEVEELVKKEEAIEVKCEFCGKLYRLSAEDVVKELKLTPPQDP